MWTDASSTYGLGGYMLEALVSALGNWPHIYVAGPYSARHQGRYPVYGNARRQICSEALAPTARGLAYSDSLQQRRGGTRP